MGAMPGAVSWQGLERMEGELRLYLARRCRDESEVDDVVQETYLRAARYRHALQEPHKLAGWTTRIASNVLRDLRRREARLPRNELSPDSEEHWAWALAAGARGETDEERDEGCVRVDSTWIPGHVALPCLGAALAALVAHDRDVLASYYGGGMSTERTARECRLPRALVKVRLFRARRRLEQRLRALLALHADGPQARTRRGTHSGAEVA